MLYFIAALIPVQLVFFQFTSTLPLFLVRNLHYPESIYGTIFTVNTLLIVALEVPLNSAMAHWSHRRTLTLGAFLYAVGFGSYALVGIAPFGKTAGVFAAVVIWTFGEMIMMPGSSAYAAEIAPPERRGEYIGSLYDVVQRRLFGGTVARREPSWPLGTKCRMGSCFRIRLYFRPDDEPHRNERKRE